MTATTTVEAGTATDVLVVPVTAVLGTVDTGTVWIGPRTEPRRSARSRSA